MLQKGQVIGGLYEIIRPVGEGGAGEVYLAYHRNLRKAVVVKQLKFTDGNVNHLRQEADILKGLHHPNLPQVYDSLEAGGVFYTVIDYVDGNSMKEYIDQGLRFDELQLIRWLTKLLDALQYLHTRQPMILHRDIKPANIMIDRNGEICLIDFNVSGGGNPRNEMQGYTPAYASPEQSARAELLKQGKNPDQIRLDGRTDIYSLSLSFYELMTGKRPGRMRGRNTADLFPVPTPYSVGLEQIIARGMSPAPKDRFASAGEMHSELLGMRRKDRELVSLGRMRAVFTSAFLILMVAGLTLSAVGFIRGRSKRLLEDISELRKDYENGEYRDVEDKGLSILSGTGYTDEEKADILYLVGDSVSMLQETSEEPDYSQAAEYLEKAWNIDNEKWDCGTAYAWALARGGQTEKADEVCTDILERCDDGRTLRIMGKRWAEIRESGNDYAGAVKVLEDVREKAGDDDHYSMLRKETEVCGDAARAKAGGVEMTYDSTFPGQAEEICSETAQATGDVEMYLEWAEVVRVLDEESDDPLADAEEVLRYSAKDDFRIYMRLSSYELKRVQNDCEGASDMQAAAWYDEAKARFDQVDESLRNEYEKEMNRLGELVDQLRDTGGTA